MLRFIFPAFVLGFVSIPYAMADVMHQSHASTSTFPHYLTLVGTYEDISGCKKACEDDLKECASNAQQVYTGDQLQRQLANCSHTWRVCRDNCYNR